MDFDLAIGIFLTVVGITGNTIVLLVFTRKMFRETSIFRFLIAITICDSLNLAFLWPINYADFFQLNSNLMECKFVMYFTSLVFTIDPWLILLCSLDRVLSAVHSSGFHLRKTLKFQLLEISVIIIIMIILNAPIFYFTKIIEFENTTSCGFDEKIPYIGFQLDSYIGFVSVLIPFILMLLSTFLIWHTLMKKKKMGIINPRNWKKDKQLVKIMIIVDLYYLICNIPYYAYVLYFDALNINYYTLLGYNFVNDLSIAFNSFCFFVYFLSIKLFRSYILKRICCKSKLICDNRVEHG